MNLAYLHPSPENFHEWRKRVKYLWHQVEVLLLIQPEILTEMANELHALSDYLGEDHDLAVLRNTILTAPIYADWESEALLFVQIIDQERLVLEKYALALGGRLFSFTPKKFIRRMKTYWRTWECEKIS